MDLDANAEGDGESELRNLSTRRISHAAASRYARPTPMAPAPAPAPVHRPPSRAPPPTQPRPRVTLNHVRSGPRQQNEYVDTPHVKTINSTTNNNTTTHVSREQGTFGLRLTDTVPPAEAIFTQPSPTGLKLHKDPNLTVDKSEHEDSIICSRCGKCKCGACTQPRELPSRWICGNKCECSAKKLVDYCSCLCCIQCIFYHSFKDSDSEDDVSAADDPCACCERPHCCKRWTCMGFMTLCLPCLWLYWPLVCGVNMCTACYNRCTRRGCNCRKDKIPSQNMTKRLLIDSESSSA